VEGSRHPFASRDKLIFAHRGGAKLAPENTMAACANAMAVGSDGLELDVHLASDGVPVVIHDQTLDRTTNASGPVGARTSTELAAVDAGYHFATGGAFPFRGCGIGVPRLEEVLRAFPAARVIVEMKQGGTTLADAVLGVLRRTSALDRVCVGSFYRGGLEWLRQHAPAVATSASENEARWTLYRTWCRWPFPRARSYCAFQVPQRAGRMQVVSRAFVKQAHGDGARVDVWVVDQPDEMTRLFEWGVDGLISDRPDIAVATRDEFMQR